MLDCPVRRKTFNVWAASGEDEAAREAARKSRRRKYIIFRISMV
jgi:hypothetical protein